MEYTAAERDLIALDAIDGLTYKTRRMATCGFKFSRPQKKYADELRNTLGEGVYEKVKEEFYDEEKRSAHLKKLEEKGIICVTLFSGGYPERLKSTPTPPPVLYCKGDISLLKTRMFTVVGSRVTQQRQLKECAQISGQVSSEFTVVTGLADGADSSAATGALNAGGKVIGVLAYGFDYLYPASNSRLIARVEAEGLLVTENLPEVQPRKYLFPVRNRILAGLSDGVLVVSAGAKSGALITAEYAFSYSRDVFSFPYSTGVASGAGCNALIKKGAYLTENILDIFGVYGLEFYERKAADLTDTQQKIAEALKEGEAHITEIAVKLGVQPYELLSDLSAMEVKGVVIRLGGNRFSLK